MSQELWIIASSLSGVLIIVGTILLIILFRRNAALHEKLTSEQASHNARLEEVRGMKTELGSVFGLSLGSSQEQLGIISRSCH